MINLYEQEFSDMFKMSLYGFTFYRLLFKHITIVLYKRQTYDTYFYVRNFQSNCCS